MRDNLKRRCITLLTVTLFKHVYVLTQRRRLSLAAVQSAILECKQSVRLESINAISDFTLLNLEDKIISPYLHRLYDNMSFTLFENVMETNLWFGKEVKYSTQRWYLSRWHLTLYYQ